MACDVFTLMFMLFGLNFFVIMSMTTGFSSMERNQSFFELFIIHILNWDSAVG